MQVTANSSSCLFWNSPNLLSANAILVLELVWKKLCMPASSEHLYVKVRSQMPSSECFWVPVIQIDLI